MTKHPIQPLEIDKSGHARFKNNAIVTFLLNWATEHGMGLNELACLDFSNEDRQQFAQLIGYSLGGFAELSYVDDEIYDSAHAMAEQGISEQDARIEMLSTRLNELRQALQHPMSILFEVHPDDLAGAIKKAP